MEKSAYENLGGLNRDFHLRIYKAAPYPRLYKMIGDLWETFERSQSVFAYVPERAVTSVEEHRELISGPQAEGRRSCRQSDEKA